VSSIKKTAYFFIIILECIFFFACAPKPENTSKHLPEMISGFTPKGWKLYDTVKQFTPENLYEHIDGRAEFYIAYDVKGLTFANFVKTDLNGPFVDLFIYDMGNPTNAFGVFSAEKSSDGVPVPFGRSAYRQGANYYIWKGQYYITVIGSETSTELEAIGKKLAEKASNALKDSGEDVWGLSAMPKKGRVAGTLKYVKTDALGLDFMKNTYMAKYRKADTDLSFFLSQKESEEEAGDVVNQYAEFAKQYGNGSEEMGIQGIHLTVCDMDGYYDVVFQKGTRVAGVLSVKEKEAAINTAVDMYNQLP